MSVTARARGWTQSQAPIQSQRLTSAARDLRRHSSSPERRASSDPRSKLTMHFQDREDPVAKGSS